MKPRKQLPEVRALVEFSVLSGERCMWFLKVAIDSSSQPPQRPRGLLELLTEQSHPARDASDHPIEALDPPIDALSAAQRTHVVWRWLNRNECFIRAREKFDQRRNKAQGKTLQASEECVFIDAVVGAIVTHAVAPQDWTPPVVTAARRGQVLERVNTLLRDIEEGVGPSSLLGLYSLTGSLKSFRDELAANHGRDYRGPDARQRYILKNLAERLQSGTGLSTPEAVEILRDCSELLGFEPSHRTLQRYAQRGVDQHKETGLSPTQSRWESRKQARKSSRSNSGDKNRLEKQTKPVARRRAKI